MKIEGQELISRGTVSSGRLQNSICLAVLLTWLFGIDTSGLSILGVDLPPEELTSALAVVIAFLFVGYAINWFGDVVAFKNWNRGDVVGGGSVFGKGGTPLRTNIETPEEIVSKLQQVEALLGQGMSRLDAIRQIGVAEQTYYRWRKQYGGKALHPART